MAIVKINNYSEGDTSIDNIITMLDGIKNINLVSITEMDTTATPKIEQGSVVEVDGDVFIFNSDTSISGVASSSILYIKFVKSDGTIIPTWTGTAPGWDSDKGGWYNGTSRYVNFIIVKIDTLYYKEEVLKSTKFEVASATNMYVSANHSINKAGYPRFNAVSADRLLEGNTSLFSFVPKFSGYYNISLCITFNDLSVSGYAMMYLEHDGDLVGAAHLCRDQGTVGGSSILTITRYLLAGEIVKSYVTSNETITIIGSGWSTLSVNRIL